MTNTDTCARCDESIPTDVGVCPACGNDPLTETIHGFGGAALVLFAVSILFPPLLLVGGVLLMIALTFWSIRVTGLLAGAYGPTEMDLPWGDEDE